MIIAVLAASGADGASAVTRHEIRHSEELKFKGAVEGVIYHSEGAAFDDHQKFVVALEAEPKELGAAGRALLGEWRTYRSYDQGHLFRIQAPAFWRHDWREWKRWQRVTLGGSYQGAQLLLAGDWPGFEQARTGVVRAEHSRDAWGRKMHLALGGGR